MRRQTVVDCAVSWVRKETDHHDFHLDAAADMLCLWVSRKTDVHDLHLDAAVDVLRLWVSRQTDNHELILDAGVSCFHSMRQIDRHDLRLAWVDVRLIKQKLCCNRTVVVNFLNSKIDPGGNLEKYDASNINATEPFKGVVMR